jgi:hypothetical protein
MRFMGSRKRTTVQGVLAVELKAPCSGASIPPPPHSVRIVGALPCRASAWLRRRFAERRALGFARGSQKWWTLGFAAAGSQKRRTLGFADGGSQGAVYLFWLKSQGSLK